jgi:tripeptide aminopeptidase
MSQMESIVDLFSKLVKIQGVSLQEHNVAAFVREFLKDMPFDTREDDAGQKLGGSTGNLIIRPRHVDLSKPLRVFMAHMDTVRDTSVIEVVIKDGKIQSDGSCQLGADNRAGVAIMLDLLSHWKQWEDHGVNYMVVLSVAEEIGLKGAYALDLSGYPVESVWVFDSSKRPGAYIRDCAGMFLFDATIIGKAAHSAVNPDAGINAIKVASDAILRMPMGKIADMTTINVGKIVGGIATNVIPPKCTVHGEVRAVSESEIHRLLAEIKQIFDKTASEYGAKVEFKIEKEFGPYSFAPDSKMVRSIEKAIMDAGLTLDPLRYTGGSDANALNENGIPAINIGIGAQNPHADDEFILVEDLLAARQIAINLMMA